MATFSVNGTLEEYIIAHHFFRCYQQISPEKMTEAGSRDREPRHVVRTGLLKNLEALCLTWPHPIVLLGHPALLGIYRGDDWCPSIHSILSN